MANGKTYGITFPFRDSFDGRYLDLTDNSDEEIRTDLIHLLLTRKGSRYFLPDFGSRIYEYIFEPLDGPTFSEIESEIRESVETYIPNLIVNKVSITPAEEDQKGFQQVNRDPNLNSRVYRIPGQEEIPYTAIVRIDYTSTDSTFNTRDFIILNI